MPFLRARTARAAAVLALAGVCCACGDSETAPPPPRDAGGPDVEQPVGCEAGEVALPDGACQAAGIPADACAEGFEADGDFGCAPILPEAACPDGQMAVPGEIRCRPVDECGAGPWGDIPLDAMTQHVDLGYAGGSNDGSAAHPWTTIQAAIDAAAPSALVAIAQGSYIEDLAIDQPVRLRGRCAGLVEIVGTGTATEVVRVGAGADGTEIGDLAITGPSAGITALGATGVVIERAWIHDLDASGVAARASAEVTVTHSLIDRAGSEGLLVATHSVLTVDASVVRAPELVQPTAVGVFVTSGGAAGARPGVTVRGSVIEQVDGAAVYIEGSDATVEATVIRDTTHAQFGWGLTVQDDPASGARGSATVRGSVIARSHDVGLFAGGSDLVVETSVVRDTLPRKSTLEAGEGISAQASPTSGGASELVVRRSLIDHNFAAGCRVDASHAEVEGTRIRDSQAQEADGQFGRGLDLSDDPMTGATSTLTLRDSIVEQATDIGVSIDTSDAALDNVAIRGTRARAIDRKFGRGVQIQSLPGVPQAVTLTNVLVDGNREVGIAVVDTAAVIDRTVVRGTTPNDQGAFGDGIASVLVLTSAQATITASRVEGNARAGVAAFAASMSIASTTLECNAIDLDGEAGPDGAPFVFDDGGGNVCGCKGVSVPCAVLTSSLEAPGPLGGP